MSELTSLLNHLLLQGVELSIEEGKVRVRAPDGSLPPESLEALRRFKEDLLRILPEHRFDAPLSAGQEGLWFIQKSAPDSVAYNVAFALRIESPRDPGPALGRALQKLVNRHALLRTTFAAVGGGPRQIVRAFLPFTLPETDASHWSLDEIVSAAASVHQRPFDVEAEGAFRACLFRRAPGECVLLLCVHHIACDGWAFRMLIDELLRLYEADGQANPLPPVRRTYQQFVAWQQEMLAARAEELRRSWMDELEGASTVLNLPTDRTRPLLQTFRGATRDLTLAPALAESLRALSRDRRTTLSTVLLAAFEILLHRYSGQDDLCVGFIVAGREHEELAGVFGYMVNQIVLRTRIQAHGDAPSFLSFVQQTRDSVLSAMSRQEYPFPRLVQDLRIDRDPSRPPVVQATFVYQRVQSLSEAAVGLLGGETVQVRDTRFSVVPVQQAISEIDLTLEVTERAAGIDLGLRYNSDLFDAGTIDRMAGHLETLLQGIVADPGRSIFALPLLTPAEREQVLVAWNRVHLAHDRESSLHGLFEAQAARTPDAPAVFFEERAISYDEINRRANQLARHLRRKTDRPETRVGVCVDRSPEMIVSLLGVLKAGFAYVPIDPAYPPARQDLMIEESRADILISRAGLGDRFTRNRIQRVALDVDTSAMEAEDTRDLGVSVPPEQLAYLLTTSGSTGRPKAVAIEHRNAVAMVHWAQTEFTADDLRGTLASTSICFDLSVFEIFLPLSVGGSVIIADNALALTQLPARDRVTLINTVPSAAAELVRMGALPRGARVVNLAGEKLSGDLVQRIYRSYAVERVYNLYGPSEATTYSTVALMARGDEREPSIGRPIANTVAYVLDPHGEPVPAGIPGELFLGGEGLARGYFNRPDLTASRFVPNPFGPGRLYRTGDLARFRPDGEIEFLGRLDNQIKLRGFRIELGEVEAALERIGAVEKAVVVAHGAPSHPRLVAYWKASSAEWPGDLQDQLAVNLPAFMVPDIYVRLDAFPLTSTGKVDRRALPAPADADLKRGEHREPETDMERTIAAIWRDVLGLARVGVEDNFFHLGGHSLLSVQVLDRIGAAFQLALPLRTMFEMPTIRAIAKHIEATIAVRRLAAERASPGAARRQSGRL